MQRKIKRFVLVLFSSIYMCSCASNNSAQSNNDKDQMRGNPMIAAEAKINYSKKTIKRFIMAKKAKLRLINISLKKYYIPIYKILQDFAFENNLLSFDIVRCHVLYGENDSNRIKVYYPSVDYISRINPNERWRHGEIREKEFEINCILMQEAIRVITNDQFFSQNSRSLFFLDYEITFVNRNIISVLYRGSYGAIAAGRGTDPIALASTVNLKNEKTVKFADVVSDIDKLFELLENDKFECLPGFEMIKTDYSERAGSDWMRLASKEELLKDERGADWLVYNEEYDSMVYPHTSWYISDDNLVILIIDLDSYDRYSIPLEEIKDIVRPEFMALLR